MCEKKKSTPVLLVLQRFKTWFLGLEIYQIFVVRAWKRQTSRGWYLLMLVPSIFVFMNCCSLIQHADTLEEMRKDTGTIESFSVGRNCTAILTLRTDDGALKSYRFCENNEQLPQRVRGRRATVWSESAIYPPFLWGRDLLQIQVDEIKEHEFNQQNHDSLKQVYIKLIKFFLPFVLIPLFRIWWVNRKAEPVPGQTTT